MTYTCIYTTLAGLRTGNDLHVCIRPWQDYEQSMTYTCIYTALAGLRTDYDVHVYIYMALAGLRTVKT